MYECCAAVMSYATLPSVVGAALGFVLIVGEVDRWWTAPGRRRKRADRIASPQRDRASSDRARGPSRRDET